MNTSAAAAVPVEEGGTTRYRVLGAISFSHCLNDLIQSLILAIYPILKGDFNLSFAQIGLITLTYQITASLLQPLVGLYTDRHPKPYSLIIGMSSTLCGLLLLSVAPNFEVILIAAALVGTGSSVFHPESSRIARLASGGKHGLAQSVFQVGGSTGSAIGPLLAAIIVLPHGQPAIAWFALAALAAILVLWQIGNWYKRQRQAGAPRGAAKAAAPANLLPPRTVSRAVTVLLLLVFSKFFYLASITSYYTFYLINHFSVSVQASQIHLFLFLFAVAAGTLIGGPIGDRYGRKIVIWVSILGVAPFTLALPYVNLLWTSILIFIVGLILSSAFSAILVYAQEMMPGKIGTVSGMFFGFAFGMGGVGAAVLGVVADHYGIVFVYQLCSFLPLMGLLTVFLPDDVEKFRHHEPARA
ncbi:MAG: MFS transporter [Burkholderiaceae bacterium]|jgi:FSR family fosmidomycin resistance protein-like MFS transporter|nr:MAG: MFS transporter [Burkholderiaceae bacterium]